MVVAAEFSQNAAFLILKDTAHGIGLVVAAVFELRFGVGLGVLAALLQVRKQFFDVTREGCLQAGGDNFWDFGLRAGVHGAFEQFEGLGFRLAGVGGEHAAPGGRLGPAGRDGEDFLVEANRASAVKRKTSKQDDARDGVGGVGQAGTGEVVVDKALGEKAPEQALNDAVLQVELDGIVVYALGRIENNGADGGFLAPLVEALVFVLGGAKGVEGG